MCPAQTPAKHHNAPFIEENGHGGNALNFRRIFEGVIIALVAGVIAGGAATWATTQKLGTMLDAQQDQISQLRREIRDMRRDLYAPRQWGEEAEVLISELKERLRDSLHGSADVFEDGDLERHIRVALNAMALHKRPRVLTTELALVAKQSAYDAPANIIAIDRLGWQNEFARTPWERKYPGPAPRPALLRKADGDQIILNPPPDRQQVDALDSKATLYYRARHETSGSGASEEVTTLSDADEDLLILRAQAEACRELSMRAITKPVELRGGGLSQPRNGSPAALFAALMTEWQAAP